MAETIDGRVRELLDAPNFAHVATLRDDGSVRSVLVWVDVEGDEVLLNSAEGRAWPADVRRDPRVSLLVASSENPYEYAEIRGRVTGDTHDGALEHINALARKYLGEDEYPYLQPGEQRITFRITPERVRLQQPG